MEFCLKCGQEKKEGDLFCPNCGLSYNAETFNCPKCNTINIKENKFCMNCGESLSTEAKNVCPDCGTTYTNEAKVCYNCGKVLKTNEQVRFEKEQEILEELYNLKNQVQNIQNSNLIGNGNATYVCSVCGKVNPISEENCLRCGRSHRRTSYLNAKKYLKFSAELAKKKNSKNSDKQQKNKSKKQEEINDNYINYQLYDNQKISKENFDESINEPEEIQENDLVECKTNQENDVVIQPIAFVPYVAEDYEEDEE